MKRHTSLMVLGSMVALAAAGTAGAATSTAAPVATQASCEALARQADTAVMAHKTDAAAKTAQEQRVKGEKACKAGEYAKGTEHLRRAITDLGMKPVN
jgi:urease alpha subunit